MKYITYCLGIAALAATLVIPASALAQTRFITPIVPANQVKITAPANETSVVVGDRIDLSWTKTSSVKAVTIERTPLFGTNRTKVTIFASTTGSTFSWVAPDLVPGKYQISVRPSNMNISSGPFFAKINVNLKARSGPIDNSKVPKVTILPSATPILAKQYAINTIDGNQVSLTSFVLKGEGSTSTIKSVSVNVKRSVGALADVTAFLYKGSTLLSSKTVPANGAVTFDSADIHVLAGSQLELTVKALVPTNTDNGTIISADIAGTTARLGQIDSSALPIVGNSATLVTTSSQAGLAQYTLMSAPIIRTMTDVSGYTTSAIATFNFNVMAIGGNVPKPTSSNFKVVFATSSPAQGVTASAVSVVTIPNNNIAQGSIAQVSITAQISGPILKNSGLYKAYLTSIDGAVSQTETPSAANVIRPGANVGFMSTFQANVSGAFQRLFSIFGF